MTALAERAQAIADHARNRVETAIAREWWLIRKPGEEDATEVFCCPPQSHAEVIARYPGAGVLPR